MSAAAKIRHRVPRRHELCLVALGLLAAYAQPSMGADALAPAASAATGEYALEPGPLADRLREIARISGRSISFDAGAVNGKTSGAVNGTLSPLAAVNAAIVHLSMEVHEASDGSLVVAAIARVIVTAHRDKAETSFKADRSDTGTRSGTNLMDDPASMTIITSKVLETEQARSIQDVLANVSGVTFVQTPQGTPTFNIRGFAETSATVNGVSDSSAALTNVFAVERVEVLKGPQAILSGAHSLGGGVNVVLKKPQADPIRSLTFQYGTYNDLTLAGDAAGALSDDKQLTYRLIVADSHASKSQAGFDGRGAASVSPELRWKDADTDLIGGIYYGQSHQPVPQYTYARRDGVILPPPALLQGNRPDGFDAKQKRIFYDLEQKLTPDVTFVSRLERSLTNLDQHLWSPAGLDYADDAASNDPSGTAMFYSSRGTNLTRTTSGDHYLRIEGATGPLNHKLSVGVNHTSFNLLETQWSGTNPDVLLYPADTLFRLPDVKADATNVDDVAYIAEKQVGMYLQDLVSWHDWNLLLNLRRTRFQTWDTVAYPSADFVFSDPKTTVWSNTPGVGVVYNVTPQISVYGNLSKGFDPQSAVSCAGGAVPPVLSHDKELGAKFDLLDTKLSLTLAAFRVTESNVLQYNQIKDCYDVRSAQVTRGIEVDMQGELAKGWSAIVNYTFSKSNDPGDPTAVFPGEPRHKMSLWTTYDLPGDTFKGLGIGAGLSAASRSLGTYDTSYPFYIPAQVQVDASAFYKVAKWDFTLGVKNIANSRLYGVSASSGYVPVLQGRNFMLTGTRNFN